MRRKRRMRSGKYLRGEKIPQKFAERKLSHRVPQKCFWDILMTSSVRKIIHEIKFFPSIPLFFASVFFHISSKRFHCACSGDGSLRVPKTRFGSIALRKSRKCGNSRERKAQIGWRHVEGGIRSSICVMCGRRASSNFPSHLSQAARGTSQTGNFEKNLRQTPCWRMTEESNLKVSWGIRRLWGIMGFHLRHFSERNQSELIGKGKSTGNFTFKRDQDAAVNADDTSK